MEKRFEGKTALITGAGSGIGAATALLFANQGCKVIVADINEQNGEDIVNRIRHYGGEGYFIPADVSNASACMELVDAAVQRYGQLDIAVNNAGIGGESNAIADMSVEGWDHVIAVNLNSVFYCMKYELQTMMKAGKGTIVNISSILGQVGFANASGYVAAKHGIVGLTKNAAIEYAEKGIRVNVVGPAFIDTPLLANSGIDNAMKTQLATLHPIGRLGNADEVATLILWLSSEEASFVNGAYYAVDGGYLSK